MSSEEPRPQGNITSDLQFLSSKDLDWKTIIKNRKKIERLKRMGRKSYVFHIGLAFLVVLTGVAIGTGYYAEVGTFAALLIGAGFSPLAAIFLAAVFKDKQIEKDQTNIQNSETKPAEVPDIP